MVAIASSCVARGGRRHSDHLVDRGWVGRGVRAKAVVASCGDDEHTVAFGVGNCRTQCAGVSCCSQREVDDVGTVVDRPDDAVPHA